MIQNVTSSSRLFESFAKPCNRELTKILEANKGNMYICTIIHSEVMTIRISYHPGSVGADSRLIESLLSIVCKHNVSLFAAHSLVAHTSLERLYVGTMISNCFAKACKNCNEAFVQPSNTPSSKVYRGYIPPLHHHNAHEF